ncbi:MAG: extracellular solute-binding protein [Spirochaetota bacterium]
MKHLLRVMILCVAGCILLTGLVFAGGKPESKEGPVKLAMWTSQGDFDSLKAMYKRFEEETGHSLSITWMPDDGFETATITKWATGERPDIISYHASKTAMLELNAKENLRDLSNQNFINKFLPGILDFVTLERKVYGIITSPLIGLGMYYNKQIFDRLGLKLPTNAAELEQVCKMIKEKDPSITPIFEAGASVWPPQILQISFTADSSAEWQPRLDNRTARVSDPDSPFLRAMRFYKKFQDSGYFNEDILTAEYEDSYIALVEGRAAMVAQHSGLVVDSIEAFGQDVVGQKVGFFAWAERKPILAVGTVPHGTYYLPKTGNPQQEAAAIKFLEFMTGPAYVDYVKKSKQLPVMKGVPVPDGLPAPTLDMKKYFDSGAITVDSPTGPGTQLRADLMNEMIAGQISPEEVARRLHDSMNQAARASGQKGWD